MKYRTKLILGFLVIVVICVAITLGITYKGSKKLFFDQIRSELLSVSLTTSILIDADEVKAINSEEAAHSVISKVVKAQLKKVRDLNRNNRFPIQYIYIIRPIKSENRFIYVADAEDDTFLESQYGDIVQFEEGLFTNLYKPFVEKNFSYGPWGSLLSAYSPIYDSNKNYVGTLGVDLDSAEIYRNFHRILFFVFITFLTSLVICLAAAYLLSGIVTKSLKAISGAVEKISEGDLSARIFIHTNDEFQELARKINVMAKGLEEREKLKSGFARYVSQYVLEKIISSNAQTKLEGERKKVTILFSDIRKFTSLSEVLPPEDIVALLNEYFERMIEIIFAYNGTLDKFIGDAIMAEFGAPIDDPLQELHTLKAAIAMQRQLITLGQKWNSEGKPSFDIGIGIHTGLAVLGNIGSEIRMEYTAVGDSVNIAAGLEKKTKELKKKIIVSSNTYDALKDLLPFEDLGECLVEGRERPVHIYALDPFDPSIQLEGYGKS